MAASDKFYRDQNTLDKVFAWSSILMLVSVVWMFAQDYFRPFKQEQRTFRDVESALAQRLALADLPDTETFNKVMAKVEEEKAERAKNQPEIDARRAKYQRLLPEKEKAEARYQGVKAELDSTTSFYDIEVEHHGQSATAERYKAEIARLNAEVEKAKAVRDRATEELRNLQQEMTGLEKGLTNALSAWKKVNDQFETQVKQAVNKRWSYADFIRALPIIDGFASPYKIQQFTLDTLPIDYNFKQVTRFDRCTTCHLGIERATYTRDNLRMLREPSPSETRARLGEARELLRDRKKLMDPSSTDYRQLPDPGQLQLTRLSPGELTDARINQFCVHPRLDLFVGADSKHPSEKFGCTSCHSGQGSATEFGLAAHSPNTPREQRRWEKEHHWESNHYWDFPMNPMRFVESSCLKCHHQVTDLISKDNRPEAPKLLRGYNLIKEAGCFGCHEIQGRKNGRPIGPDLRLEANPPLEQLTASERAKILADPDNAPGNLRKVGPNLYRLAEKTNQGFVAKWLRAPREFRPDTKMPHFYGLSNNHPDVLPEAQKKFPDAEIQAITYYLFKESQDYLDRVAKYRSEPSRAAKDAQRLATLEKLGENRTREENDELEELKYYAFLRHYQVDLPIARNQILPEDKGDPAVGRKLIVEKGCLSCHRHEGTRESSGKNPGVESTATFAPNLSQVRGKFGNTPEDEQKARQWLRHWIKNPFMHSPRTTMPVTHLTDKEVTDVAAWLLSQPAKDLGEGWANLKVPEPADKDLYDLAEVYLVRQLSEDNLKKLQQDKTLPAAAVSDLPGEERRVVASYTPEHVKYYVGKKAIMRLGCNACHDIPRLESTKPIGTGLNDWGKKPGDRLAFEDIVNFVKKNYEIVPSLTDKDGKPVPPVTAGEGEQAKKKLPYEEFFFHALEHKQREGFLHQKLLDPRSYDYLRIRPWDDRSRMPQFRFTRQVKKKGESPAEFEARAWKEEADAREAVMTFILGLTAEQVPLASINQPRGERLAEVKGRQVLDKFNCAGCHVIRPGIYEFKNSPQLRENLTRRYQQLLNSEPWKGDFPQFAPNYLWQGDPSSVGKDTITMYGVPRVDETDDEANPYQFRLRLTQALRFQTPPNGAGGPVAHDLRAGDIVFPTVQDLVYPQKLRAPEDFKNFAQKHGAYGGAFSDLLVRHLTKVDPTIFTMADGDSTNARAAGPPSLINQGRRTQPAWLYLFLLHPEPIRKMTVLRMPRFNMSEEEARVLVDYFAGTEALVNSRVALDYPYPTIEQHTALKENYWTKKTSEYLQRLQTTKVTLADGKETTAYQKRVAELEPVWKQIAQDYERSEKESEAKATATAGKLKEAEAEKVKADKALAENKDAAKKASLEAAAKAAKTTADEAKRLHDTWADEAKKAKEARDNGTPDKLKKLWETQEAYVVDGYRLLVNRNLCLTCHQVGNYQISGGNAGQGPPLQNAEKRLRPDWIKMWVAHPERFLTYKSPMPVNFPANEKKWQEFFVGSSLDQVTAVRDVLMMHERAAALPLNRYWALPLTGDKK